MFPCEGGGVDKLKEMGGKGEDVGRRGAGRGGGVHVLTLSPEKRGGRGRERGKREGEREAVQIRSSNCIYATPPPSPQMEK